VQPAGQQYAQPDQDGRGEQRRSPDRPYTPADRGKDQAQQPTYQRGERHRHPRRGPVDPVDPQWGDREQRQRELQSFHDGFT
jgi:hypothetical protein